MTQSLTPVDAVNAVFPVCKTCKYGNGVSVGKCYHPLSYEAQGARVFMSYASKEFMRTAENSPCGVEAKLWEDQQ